jgi:ABC-type sugar transport system substrate-binding protein
MQRAVFMLLVGSKERGQTDEYQLLQEQAALDEGRRAGIDVEVAFAAAFDQLRTIRRRLNEASSRPVHCVVTEPASSSAMEFVLRDLRGKVGLVLVNAWGPSVDGAASSWGTEHPFGTVSTDHKSIGEIQGRQISTSAPQGATVLCVTGPSRSSAAEERLAGVRATLRPDLQLVETHGGEWTEADGAAAFNSWYGVFKARTDTVPVVACQSDELAVGAMKAAQAIVNPAHRDMFARARFLGVDGCPNYGKRLVDEGKLAATVVTPPNTDIAIAGLKAFWADGKALPVRHLTKAKAYPPASMGLAAGPVPRSS